MNLLQTICLDHRNLVETAAQTAAHDMSKVVRNFARSLACWTETSWIPSLPKAKYSLLIFMNRIRRICSSLQGDALGHILAYLECFAKMVEPSRMKTASEVCLLTPDGSHFSLESLVVAGMTRRAQANRRVVPSSAVFVSVAHSVTEG